MSRLGTVDDRCFHIRREADNACREIEAIYVGNGMTMAEVDLLGAERSLAAALARVKDILTAFNKRRETAA